MLTRDNKTFVQCGPYVARCKNTSQTFLWEGLKNRLHLPWWAVSERKPLTIEITEIFRDCLIIPHFDHKGTKSQRLKGKNFVALCLGDFVVKLSSHLTHLKRDSLSGAKGLYLEIRGSSLRVKSPDTPYFKVETLRSAQGITL